MKRSFRESKKRPDEAGRRIKPDYPLTNVDAPFVGCVGKFIEPYRTTNFFCMAESGKAQISMVRITQNDIQYPDHGAALAIR